MVLFYSLIILFVFLICNTAHRDRRKHIGDYDLRWIRPFPYRNSFDNNFVCPTHVSNETITDKCSLYDFKDAGYKTDQYVQK